MELRDSRVYYGICSTDEDQATKDVVIMNPILVGNNLDLAIGDELIVKFEKGNTNPEPTLNLNISDNNNNVTVSANSGYRVLIDEICDWGAQTIVSFVYVYGAPVAAVVTEREVNSEIVRTVTEIGAESMYWKPIDYKIASEDTYGVTKLVTNVNELEDENNQPDNRPVSYNIIKGLFNNLNSSLGLKYSSNGSLSLANDGTGSTTISLPIPPNRTSQLTNDGEGNGRFWSSNKNNYVDSLGLGIGYPYIRNRSNTIEVMKSFQPYTVFNDNGNMIRIGRDALKAYQDGIIDNENNLIEKNPYVRLYGNNIDLAIDKNNGIAAIGDIDISGNKNDYNRRYIFTPSGVTFNKPLTANKLITSSIVYNDSELSSQLADFRIQVYNTPELKYPASSAQPTNSANNTIKGVANDNLALEIKSIPSGYRPIAIAGYNINSDGSQVHYMNMWECFVYYSEDKSKYYIRYGMYNSKTSASTVSVQFKVLFTKRSLVTQTTIS